jgi:hypothetical protein
MLAANQLVINGGRQIVASVCGQAILAALRRPAGASPAENFAAA